MLYNHGPPPQPLWQGHGLLNLALFQFNPFGKKFLQVYIPQISTRI